MTAAVEARPLGWPSEHHTWLLRAALLEGEAAREAWGRWQVGVDFAQLDAGTYRMLPLLQRNLAALGIVHPEGDRWRGVQRLTWARTQVKIARVAQLVRQLRAAGVADQLFLKGLPLALHVYADVGLRPMEDIDLLIRPADLQVTRDVLLEQGWTLKDAEPGPWAYELPYVHADGTQLDLHWRSHYHLSEAHDLDMWDASVNVSIGDVTVRAPDPVQLLLHVLVHGGRHDPVPPIRWVADSILLLRAAPFDDACWARFVACARKAKAVLPVRNSLTGC